MFAIIQNLRRVLLPKEKFLFLGLTVLVFFGSLLELTGIGITMPVIAMFVNENLFRENELLAFFYRMMGAPEPKRFMLLTCSMIAAFFFLKNIFLFVILWFQLRYSYSLAERTSKALFLRYMEMPYSFHLNRNTALSIEIMNSTRYALSEMVSNLMFLLSELMVIVVIFISILFVAPEVALIMSGIILLLSAAIYFPLKRVEAFLGQRTTLFASRVTASIIQLMEAIKEIKLAGRGVIFYRNFRQLQTQAIRNQRLLVSFAHIPRFLIEAALVAIGMGTIVGLLLMGVTPSSIALKISFIGIALIRVMPSIVRSHYYVATLKGQEGPMMRIIRDLNELKREEFPVDRPPLTLSRNLRLENLSFAYKKDKFLFRNLNFTIPAKTSIALVGPTGCGKTTLIDLIIGLHTPVEGRILSDGRDIQENMPSWRARIGYVPQMIPIADASVLENVAFGFDPKEIDREQVIESLKMAQAYAFVEKLEHGLDTIVGERGIRLSGGQRQRIGIARALYTHPELLVFDEATSALDVRTEAEFVEALSALRGKITMVVAAHRLSTVENCDATLDFSEVAKK